MLIVVDSGSTKADWRIISDDNQQSTYSTMGFNPFLHTTNEIIEVIDKEFTDKIDVNKVSNIYYYGAGCSDEAHCEIVDKALKAVFPNAETMVDHDILAAAKATCGDEPGISCILGTGSNSCYYDGNKIAHNNIALDYILGDEGSGFHLGKLLIRAFAYGELSPELENKFKDQYNLTKQQLLSEVYSSPMPKVYIAKFSRFLSDHRDHLYIQLLVKRAFDEFYSRHLNKYPQHTGIPIHFVGSVAHYFRDILEIVLQERNLTLGTIIKKPISNLVDYHLKKLSRV